MAGALVLSLALIPVAAQDPAPAAGAAAEPRATPFGADEVAPFVPLHPRTAEDRKELEALRDYAVARALERRDPRAAAGLLEKALERSPDSVPILRRLSRLCLALGRADEAMNYARRVLEVEPGDTMILMNLLQAHLRRNDPAGAEAMLTAALANPKLPRQSAGYLFIQRSLGDLYGARLHQPAKAAEAFSRLMEGLDEKAANKLSLGEQRLILGPEPAGGYSHFGQVLFEAKRYDLAARAFQRGLAYDPDHAELPLWLARALVKGGQPERALAALDPYLRRQPQGREPYELLVEILGQLKRSEEVLPRLEAAAKNDPKNAPLQYFLADRYREAGQREKADELYRQLLATQPDPQGFGALSASLLRDRKSEELIKLFGEAVGKPETFQAVQPQIEAVANDPAYAEELLVAALKLQEADPPKLTDESRRVLAYIANKAKKLDKLIPIQRLALRREPTARGYQEFWLDLYRAGQYAEAAAILDEMIAKFPDERTEQILTALAQSRSQAGDVDGALTAIDEALRLAPGNVEALGRKGFYLGKLGRNDDAIAFYKDLLDRFPNNAELVKQARSGLSIIYVNMDRLDEGERELEILYERDPEDAGINNDLGYLYADRGKNLEKAEAMIRKAIAEDPDNTAYLDSLGWVLFRRGRIKEALEPLEKAAAAGSDATILDHLGDVYFKLREVKKAGESWKRAEQFATSTNPPDRRLGEIRKKLESLRSLDPALLERPGDEPNP